MIREWQVLETIVEFDFQPLKLEEVLDFGFHMVQSTIISYILESQKMDEGFQKWFSKVVAKEPYMEYSLRWGIQMQK